GTPHGVELGGRDVEATDDGVVQDLYPALPDRSHRQLRLPGNAQLANQYEVERSPEGLCHLGRHRHTAARQTEDDGIVPSQMAEFSREPATGVDSILEIEPPAVHRGSSFPCRLR